MFLSIPPCFQKRKNHIFHLFLYAALSKDFNPKAVSKLMGHAKEIITMDVYADNANIIPDEIPELLSYMDEVMPDKSGNGDSESNIQDIMIDMDAYLSEKKSGTIESVD